MMRGEDHPLSKLTEEMVIDARCHAREGILTTNEIIERIGADVSNPTMTLAINGRTWAYLNEAFPPPPRRPSGGGVKGERRGPGKPRRLTGDQVRGIRAARAARTTLQAVADQYGVSRTLVREIEHRRQYADIPDEAPS